MHMHQCRLYMQCNNISAACAQVETVLLPEASPSLQSKETDLEVGRWGEELVYRFLMQHQRDSAQGWEVLWVNQAFNTGTPYDIHLRQAAVPDA